jgi:hypothetical protein
LHTAAVMKSNAYKCDIIDKIYILSLLFFFNVHGLKNRVKKTSRKSNQRVIPHHVKKGLGFHSLVRELSECFLAIPDMRQPKKVTYPIRDCLMSGLGMMFLQDPSLLQFQRRMQDEYEANNLETLFGVSKIPSDTQMRVVIDSVPTEKIANIFPIFLRLLQRGQHLKNYNFMDGW